jgi:(1->4)-alpha-D-glucan 1-alpha-D-glucosylmutase
VALGVLVEPGGMRELNEIYEDFTAEPTDFHAIAHDKKIAVTQEALGSDVNRLTTLLVDICEANRDQRDYTRAEMRRAIREVAACFAVYRSYVGAERGEIAEEDREAIGRAVECAKQNRQDIGAGLFDFMRDVLTLEVKGKQESEFLLRFQQFTPPAMAKGVEDTAFYCYNRLSAMCEVGGDPGSDGMCVEGFHAYNAKMQATHPRTMVTLSTHDTKRSDDVRARLAVLSEMPKEFGAALMRWSRINNELRAELFGGGTGGGDPDRNTEYLLYQTLVGAWPITVERAQEYMLKAVREAKQRTSWTANNAEFEDALGKFIEAVLGHQEFVTDLERFVDGAREAGRVNSLSQTLMKHTAPGVPDLYQGAELWDLSLVDPDNRRPVDFALRTRLLGELKRLPPERAVAEAMRRADEGLPKMWTIHRALCLRRHHPEWFDAEAGYGPLEVEGAKAAHAIAYLRGESVATVVPRWTKLLGGAWSGTAVQLPEGRWTNWLTGAAVEGGSVEVAELLREFPVSLLVRRDIRWMRE